MRYLISLALGFLVAIGLFGLMNHLINNEDRELVQGDDLRMVEFVRVKRDETIKEKKREVPKKPPPKRPPPPPELKVSQTVDKPNIPKVDMDIPKLDMNLNLAGGTALGQFAQAGAAQDGALVPLATFPPQFPRKAIQGGIEGWVEVEFTVTERGTVTDVKILKAKPRRIFNAAAKKTIKKWKFRPKMVDGKPVSARATQVIDFKMEG